MIEYTSEVIGISGIVIGVIGVVLYLKGRKVKRLSFGTRRTRVLAKEREVPDLKIFFKNEVIEKLFLTRVAIYNDGNQVIDASDVAKKDPLRIVIPDGFRIFDAGVFFVRNEANDFSLEMNREEGVIWITFDYMNEGDGCVVEMFDDIDMFQDISVTGSIKGIKKIQKKALAYSYLRENLGVAFLALFSIVIYFFLSQFIPPSGSFFISISAAFVLALLVDRFLLRKLLISHTEYYLEKI